MGEEPERLRAAKRKLEWLATSIGGDWHQWNPREVFPGEAAALLAEVERLAGRVATLQGAVDQIAETARWYANNGDRLPLEVDHALCVEILDVAERAADVGGSE